jgi:hypothetical protein
VTTTTAVIPEILDQGPVTTGGSAATLALSPVSTTLVLGTNGLGEGGGFFRKLETLSELRVAIISAETARNYSELAAITGQLKQIGNVYLLVLPDDAERLAEALMPLMGRTMSVQLYGVTETDRSLRIFKGTLSEYDSVPVTPVTGSFPVVLRQILSALAGVSPESVTDADLDQVTQSFATLTRA